MADNELVEVQKWLRSLGIEPREYVKDGYVIPPLTMELHFNGQGEISGFKIEKKESTRT